MIDVEITEGCSGRVPTPPPRFNSALPKVPTDCQRLSPAAYSMSVQISSE